MDSVLHFLVPTLLVVGTVVFMEWFAAWSHEPIMHGWGWGWHKSHHEHHDDEHGPFEVNDLYAVVFGALSMVLFWLGSTWFWPLTWIATGLVVYGILYFFMHDGLVHQRWPFRHVPRKGYLKRVYQAHRLHHAVEGKDGCVSFGFVYAEPVDKLVTKLQQNKRGYDTSALSEKEDSAAAS